MMKQKNKQYIIFSITIIMIMLAILNPIIYVFADEDNANEKLNQEIDNYLEGTDEFTDVIEKLQNDAKTNANPDKNTILHVLKRLFAPGEYLNDVEHGVLSDKLGVKKEDILYNDRYLCNPNAPNNLINHNCNIPNFTTDLFQTFLSPLMTPFNNAEKTASYALFGLGVPKGIPGDKVPVNPNERIYTYTALELYGYSLPRISYNGEWDKIEVSTEARMLSNFGLVDKITLMGTGLWNATKTGIGALIENFSFNPLRWGKLYTKTLEGFLTGGINVVVDTSDLNVVATNRWKRSSFNNTLYNVYVMTDKEVLLEINKKYFQLFIDKLTEKADVSPELLEVIELELIPGFEFDPEWETEESIQAREEAEAHNEYEDYLASQPTPEGQSPYIPNYVTVPEPVFYTEEEQLDFWADDNSDFLARGANQGLISGNSADYVKYETLVEEWNEAWEAYFSREFNALGDVVNDLIEESDLELFTENPHLDPKQGISHYACANEDGTIMKNGSNIEYLYLKNNKGDIEYLNPNCKLARPPIGGGLFGDGWHISRPVDTRHTNYINIENLSSSTLNNAKSTGHVLSRGFSSLAAQVTNTIIGLAFSPILDELGVTTIISELVAGFRDTIFFPLASLVAAIGAILLFLKLLQNASAWQLIVSIFFTFLIFVAGATFLLNPEATIKTIDTIPTKIENYLANAILLKEGDSSYCSTGSESDGIRTAQCNVWGTMVFNPWVYSQFGTNYEDLFANGYGDNSFQNTNEELVGDASVNMGGGHIINNWAIYQLDKTKAGTINNWTVDTNFKIGTVDKDLYRLVDLQAGPNNGLGTDPRYFKVWSGQESAGSLGGLFVLQTILLSVVLISISFLKIEASLVFGITFLFFPIMLLFGLLPEGKIKLKNFISSLITLLLKRVIIVIMLSILLNINMALQSSSSSMSTISYMSIVISVVFLIYRKELLNLTVGGDGGKRAKEFISQTIPTSMKHSYQMRRANMRGSVAGFAGGVLGGAIVKRELKNELDRKIEEANEEINSINSRKGPISQEELTEIEKIKEKISKLETEHQEIMSSKEFNLLEAGSLGSRQSTNIIGRRTERQIRKEGFTVSSVYSNAKEKVIMEGADSITNKDEATSLDTYKELLSHSKLDTTKTSSEVLSREEARLLQNPKIQREIRKLARERENIAKDNINNKEHNALSPDIAELEKIAKYIDRKRKTNVVKGKVFNPKLEKEIKEERLSRDKNKGIKSNISDLIIEEIDKTKEEFEKGPQGFNDSKQGQPSEPSQQEEIIVEKEVLIKEEETNE